jgi:tetratricopeptide (TPR) repeat protein
MIRTVFIFLVFSIITQAQPNCNFFLMNKDTAKYEACEYVSAHNNDYYQFDWRQMDIWNKAIAMCPYFAYPIREYGVPYLKAGNFIEWKKYIDRAVELEPMEYLGIRASLKCKFVADYEGAINDIEACNKLFKGNDIGYSNDGTYHLNMVKGLCLKALGRINEAIDIWEYQLAKDDHFLGKYDYLHIGVLYYNDGKYKEAIKYLEKQTVENDIAENRYYLAKCYRALGNKTKYDDQIATAHAYITKSKTMSDPYSELFDQVYMQDILEEMNKKWR